MRKKNGIGQAVALFAAAFLAFCGFWLGVFWICRLTGFESQATPQYGFTSGIGPMILTGLGMATIITGMWHGFNCHQDGCYRIGRHKVNGTPWCNEHHEQARIANTDSELLSQLLAELRKLNETVRDRL